MGGTPYVLYINDLISLTKKISCLITNIWSHNLVTHITNNNTYNLLILYMVVANLHSPKNIKVSISNAGLF
jgi:hypothetical protein